MHLISAFPLWQGFAVAS